MGSLDRPDTSKKKPRGLREWTREVIHAGATAASLLAPSMGGALMTPSLAQAESTVEAPEAAWSRIVDKYRAEVFRQSDGKNPLLESGGHTVRYESGRIEGIPTTTMREPAKVRFVNPRGDAKKALDRAESEGRGRVMQVLSAHTHPLEALLQEHDPKGLRAKDALPFGPPSPYDDVTIQYANGMADFGRRLGVDAQHVITCEFDPRGMWCHSFIPLKPGDKEQAHLLEQMEAKRNLVEEKRAFLKIFYNRMMGLDNNALAKIGEGLLPGQERASFRLRMHGVSKSQGFYHEFARGILYEYAQHVIEKSSVETDPVLSAVVPSAKEELPNIRAAERELAPFKAMQHKEWQTVASFIADSMSGSASFDFPTRYREVQEVYARGFNTRVDFRSYDQIKGTLWPWDAAQGKSASTQPEAKEGEGAVR